MDKDYFDPKTISNPSGNQTQVGRSNEALRLAYILLFNFAYRVGGGNPEKLDEDYFAELPTFMVPRNAKDESPEPSYRGLMLEVQDELNFFINGTRFDEPSNSLAILDAEYLDALADALGDLDGVVGYILAGNFNVSDELLRELCESEFSLVSRANSTKKRALAILEARQ
jgi:hypothetical protein